MLAVAYAPSYSIGELVLRKIGGIEFTGRGLNKTAVKTLLHIAWSTVGNIIERVVALGPRIEWRVSIQGGNEEAHVAVTGPL